MRTPVSQLMSIEVSEANMHIELENDLTFPMHMYSALEYPLNDNVGLMLVQGVIEDVYTCWLIRPLKPSTLFHGGLLEML